MLNVLIGTKVLGGAVATPTTSGISGYDNYKQMVLAIDSNLRCQCKKAKLIAEIEAPRALTQRLKHKRKKTQNPQFLVQPIPNKRDIR